MGLVRVDPAKAQVMVGTTNKKARLLYDYPLDILFWSAIPDSKISWQETLYMPNKAEFDNGVVSEVCPDYTCLGPIMIYYHDFYLVFA